ncbi:MAG: hypothetical protein J6W29_07045 [Neisseriaceae bacterium]|nr:hypothetical protein [Neisseriaceae bacterium]
MNKNRQNRAVENRKNRGLPERAENSKKHAVLGRAFIGGVYLSLITDNLI